VSCHDKLIGTLLLLFCASLWLSAPRLLGQSAAPLSSKAPTGYVGNEACARCHSSIVESYKHTAMAHASGPAEQNLISGDFTHQKSNVHYRIYSENGRVWLSFERRGAPSVSGTRQLLFYIGSGRRGRSYLFSVNGFLFESPVNWYADEHVWDMTPAYQDVKEIPLNLPANPSCLQCHVSGMQPPVKGTVNRYPDPIFAYNGIVCERCHGPGSAHVNGGPIINPAKLAPARRDSICMECHLEGNVAIERAGRHAYDFRPGDLLSDYVRHYVLTSTRGKSLGAVTQVEALAQSECKRKSGEAMSCTSCHNPHASPSAEERVSYYRGKCFACHGEAFGTKHHPEQPDCTRCHMPASPSTDIAHTQVTDHRIPRNAETQPAHPLLDSNSKPSSPHLLPFPDSEDAENDIRDLALAWEFLAQTGKDGAEPEAQRLLHIAVLQSPNDPALLSALGYIEQKRGNVGRALELYQKALALDPDLIDAAANLAVIEANQGRLREPLRLWQSAFERAPARSAIGMNVARIFCAAGEFGSARSTVSRVLEFNPDMAAAKELLQHLNRTPPVCEP
jgi:predicted CXXCH cytochrome family protein